MAQHLKLLKFQMSKPDSSRSRQRWRVKLLNFNWFSLLALLLTATAWYIFVPEEAPNFLLASPVEVLRELFKVVANGSLLRNAAITLLAVLAGLLLGSSLAFTVGYAITRSRWIERAVGPLAVGFQAVPMLVIAPILIRLLGANLTVNLIVCALIVFFPMLVSTMVAMRSIDPALRDLMRALRASPAQTFWKLELPAALPVLFGGLRISVTLAVIGAVVAESVRPEAGLGFMIFSAQYLYDTSQVYVGILVLVGLALTLYELTARLERRLLRWQRAGRV
jgi:NitT/TauT family transport system permease protein